MMRHDASIFSTTSILATSSIVLITPNHRLVSSNLSWSMVDRWRGGGFLDSFSNVVVVDARQSEDRAGVARDRPAAAAGQEAQQPPGHRLALLARILRSSGERIGRRRRISCRRRRQRSVRGDVIKGVIMCACVGGS